MAVWIISRTGLAAFCPSAPDRKISRKASATSAPRGRVREKVPKNGLNIPSFLSERLSLRRSRTLLPIERSQQDRLPAVVGLMGHDMVQQPAQGELTFPSL